MKIDFNNNLSKGKRSYLSKSTRKKDSNKKSTQLPAQFSILDPELRNEYYAHLSKIPNKLVNEYTSLYSKRMHPILKGKTTKQSFDSDIEFLLSTSNEITKRELETENSLLLPDVNKVTNASNQSELTNQKVCNYARIHENSGNTDSSTNPRCLNKCYNTRVSSNIENLSNINSTNNCVDCNLLYNKKPFDGDSISHSNFSNKKNQPCVIEISENPKNLSGENARRNSSNSEHLDNNTPSKLTEVPDSVKGIFNTPHIPARIENQDLNILQILEEKEDMLRDTLYNMPNYLFTLKNEHINTKNILDKIRNEFSEQSKVNEELVGKLNSLINESNEKSERLLKLIDENESLRNKQKVLELYKEETKGYLEILKKDNEDKLRELEVILKENTEYKMEKTRTMFSTDMLIREKNELMRNFNCLEQDKELIREELKCLKEFVEVTLEKIIKSGVFEQIEKLEHARKEMFHYKYFFDDCSVTMKCVSSNVDIFKSELGVTVDKFTKILEDKENEIKTLKLENEEMSNKNTQMNTCLNRIKEDTSRMCREIERARVQIHEVEEFIQQDKIKKQFIEIINGQKMELETQRIFYERRIQELTEKLEEQIDVWDVFK